MTNTLTVTDIINDIKGKNTPVASYLESEHRNFAIYTLQNRAIPFFCGLKPVHQRCLWQLRNTTKHEKVAKLSGQVMAIHPHGDCLDFGTEVLLADGSHIKIGEWVEQNPEAELLITAFDRENEKFITTNAKPTNGKIVTELMEIEFENGAIIRTSLDHKFLLDDGKTYVKAEDLSEKVEIKSF